MAVAAIHMTRDEAFQLTVKRHEASFQGLPWQAGDTIIRDIFNSGWAAHGESLKQVNLWEDSPPVALKSVYPAAEIYANYPKKVGKQAALAAIDKALRNLKKSTALGPDGFTYLLARTKAYAAATASWPDEDKKFVPHAATFYNQGRYEDDPAEWVRGTPAPKSQFSKSY